MSWFRDNIEGGGIVAVIVVFLCAWGISGIHSSETAEKKYRLEHNLVKVSGYVPINKAALFYSTCDSNITKK